MMRLVRSGLAGLAIAGAFGIAHPAGAQRPQSPVAAAAAAESTLDARTRELASQLRCPVCQGLSLQDSPSELSQEMRDVIRQQLIAGRSKDQVKEYFVGRYGEWILMEPRASGFNWIVYALPFLVLGGGAWVLVVALRRWTATSKRSTDPSPQSGSTRTLL